MINKMIENRLMATMAGNHVSIKEKQTIADSRNEYQVFEVQQKRKIRAGYLTLTFKDVEKSLETYSGDGTQNVRQWLILFEETANMCIWTDEQSVIYAKR